MGYARIVMGVEASSKWVSKRASSEQILAKYEARLKAEGILFVEDCTENETIIRWGSDLTAEEKADMQAEVEA